MAIPKFSEAELKVVRTAPDFFGGPDAPIYDFPVSPREAYLALYAKKPVWQIVGLGTEQVTFTPGVNPDNVARAFVFDGTTVPGVSNTAGGKDMFGIDWEFIPQVGGSMVRPGKPFLEDANEWYDKLVWPDIDSWDWEGSAKANAGYLTNEMCNYCMIMNGWYERLISFMDFEGAIMAMIDEDQKQAVKDLFSKLSDLYIRLIDKYLEYFPQIDGFCMHDDWGSQKETFFSPSTAAEMLVPYMRHVTDHIHSKGKFADLHSCGQLLKQVPNIIAAGWDSWTPQIMNDTDKIYELYGDQLIVAVLPEQFDPKNTTEEEQRAMARRYAEKYCSPEKPSMWSMYASIAGYLTPAFREELYKETRLRYGG